MNAKSVFLLVRIAKPMIAWHYYALMVADGLMACGMPRAGGMNGAHFRTLWAEERREERRADQGMKKSVVGIKPNGSCYFFSGERGRKKEKNPRLTNVRRPSGAVSSSSSHFGVMSDAINAARA